MTKIKKDHRGLCLVKNKPKKQAHVSDYLGDRSSVADDMNASEGLVEEERKSKEFAAETVRLSKLGK